MVVWRWREEWDGVLVMGCMEWERREKRENSQNEMNHARPLRFTGRPGGEWQRDTWFWGGRACVAERQMKRDKKHYSAAPTPTMLSRASRRPGPARPGQPRRVPPALRPCHRRAVAGHQEEEGQDGRDGDGGRDHPPPPQAPRGRGLRVVAVVVRAGVAVVRRGGSRGRCARAVRGFRGQGGDFSGGRVGRVLEGKERGRWG